MATHDWNLSWIGVDLDHTLATYSGWDSCTAIGDPIPAMVERIKRHLDDGYTVKVLTARMATRDPAERLAIQNAIWDWTLEHLGVPLDATSEKDFHMWFFYDDKAVQVEPDTGVILGREHPAPPRNR